MPKRIPITELASVNIDTINKEDLVDVSGFTFDNSVPQEQRAARIVAAVKNPYCFSCGRHGRKAGISRGCPRPQDVLTDLLKRKKSGL
jgi:hypothetical protein